MEFPQLVKDVEAHDVYKEWKEQHAESFLAHIFVMIEGDAAHGYQVGYYDTKDQKITSFLVREDKSVSVLPPSDIFKDPTSELQALDIAGIEFSTEDALAKAHDVREDDYKGIPVVKVFFIIQTLPEVGRVFNITFVTQDLKTLNVKLDAGSGEVVKHTLQSLVQQQ